MAEDIMKAPYKPYKTSAYQKLLGLLTKGYRRGQACKLAGLDRSTFCDRMKADPAFREQVAECEGYSVECVEEALMKKALEGNVTAMIFVLCNRLPDKWANVSSIKPQVIQLQQPEKQQSTEELKTELLKMLDRWEDDGSLSSREQQARQEIEQRKAEEAQAAQEAEKLRLQWNLKQEATPEPVPEQTADLLPSQLHENYLKIKAQQEAQPQPIRPKWLNGTQPSNHKKMQPLGRRPY